MRNPTGPLVSLASTLRFAPRSMHLLLVAAAAASGFALLAWAKKRQPREKAVGGVAKRKPVRVEPVARRTTGDVPWGQTG